MRKITSLLMLFLCCVGMAWGQFYSPGERTTTLVAGKKYFIGVATYYGGACANLLYNNGGTLAKSNDLPNNFTTGNVAYLFTVEEVGENNTYYIKNSNSKYLQSGNLASTETKTGITVVPYNTVKGSVACGNDVQACDENGNIIRYDDITDETPIVCVYENASKGWRYIYSLQTGKSTPFAFYEVIEHDVPFEVTTDETAPIYYTIKNLHASAYAVYDGDGESMKLRPNVESSAHLFYFTAGTTAGTYKIHSAVTTKKCAATNSWTEDGIDWYIKVSGSTNYSGVAISKEETLTADTEQAWNDYQGNRTSVAYWGGNDDGSVWEIEKHEGVKPGLQLSTDDNIVLHYIRSNRRDSYVNFVGHNITFKEGEQGYGSYWYFVEDETATNVPEGYVACKIFNAAHPTAVENHTSGYMEDANWPAKTFYIGYRENDNFGYVIHLPGEDNGWHDYSGTYIGGYGLGDNGSLWRIYPAGKTVDQLKSEAGTAKTNALTFIAEAEEADFYTYTDEAIATAKTAVESVDVNTLHTAVSSLLNNPITALKATEKATVGPAAGQYIQLKNKNYKKYLTLTDAGKLTSVADANDRATLWVVEEGTDGNVKLKHAATDKYIGEIRRSAEVNMVEAGSEKQFAFTNQADCYAVFKETSGGGYAYGHIDGNNKLVGWEPNADATQWVVSEYTLDESLSDLQAIYNVVDNAFGTEPGQYKEMVADPNDNLYTAYTLAYDAISSDTEKDVYMISLIADNLNAQWDTQLANPDSREINLPVTGKFYRLKNVASGRYMNVKSASSIVVTDEGDNLPATIFYLGENNTLTSYSIGQYLDCQNKNLAAVGTSHNGEFAAARSGAKPNTVMYKNNGYWTFGNRDNDVSIDRGSTKPGANALGYDWELEEVEWLPIPVNVEAGWTSIYSPVELELSYNRFKAYTVSEVSETSATLAEQTVVPAGVGVVLEYQDGAQVVDGCVYLQVKDSETTGVTSALLGTYADEYISKDAYVLGMVDSKVGFYTATKNQQENTAFLNNGFKVYLPMTATQGANMLRFNFDGETTAIDAVEVENANAPIYDLSGRRVLSTVKGGVYIQNGKKFIVK